MYRRLNVVAMHSGLALQQLVALESRRTLPPALQGIEPVD